MHTEGTWVKPRADVQVQFFSFEQQQALSITDLS